MFARSNLLFLLTKQRLLYKQLSYITYNHYTFNKGNNKITELRTILQRESPNS